MSLTDRRALKEFETKRYPLLKKEIDEAAGFELPVEVKWDTLALEEMGHLYEECWPRVYFQPLIEALKAITVDDLGREALKKGVKKIEIQNVAGIYYGDRMATLEGGVLRLDHKPTTNVDDVNDRRKGIQELLESKL